MWCGVVWCGMVCRAAREGGTPTYPAEGLGRHHPNTSPRLRLRDPLPFYFLAVILVVILVAYVLTPPNDDAVEEGRNPICQREVPCRPGMRKPLSSHISYSWVFLHTIIVVRLPNPATGSRSDDDAVHPPAFFLGADGKRGRAGAAFPSWTSPVFFSAVPCQPASQPFRRYCAFAGGGRGVRLQSREVSQCTSLTFLLGIPVVVRSPASEWLGGEICVCSGTASCCPSRFCRQPAHCVVSQSVSQSTPGAGRWTVVTRQMQTPDFASVFSFLLSLLSAHHCHHGTPGIPHITRSAVRFLSGCPPLLCPRAS